MKRLIKHSAASNFLVLFLGLQPTASSEDKPPPPLLIDAASLEKRLESSQLAILDTRSNAEYKKSHIPGALWVDVAKWTELAHSDGGLRNAQAWAQVVGALGIAAEDSVVVYGTRPTDTARLWWTLKYLGIREALFLDGGWQIWEAEKRPTDQRIPNVTPATFTPTFQKDRLAEIDEVKKALGKGSVAILDARSDGEFNGKVVRGPRGGHIPGAIHLEWKHFMAADGRFKRPQEIRALLEKHGIVSGKTLVPY